jgi:hypothetical protein
MKRAKVKPYSIKELAELYEVDPKTFRKWLEPFCDELEEKKGWYYSIPQVEIIFFILGVPTM